MKNVILIDFGSTYTKAAAVSLTERRLLFATRVPSTVKSQAWVGLRQCLATMEAAIGKKVVADSLKLASSSAAGGLRMAVVGLSETLSITAGRNVAFGAGAKILRTLAGKIRPEEADAIADSAVEILLFCGGYEQGNTAILLHNAEILATSRLHVPVIFAGNSAVAREVRHLFARQGKECFITRNIIPRIGELDPAAAEGIIRDLFLQRIVDMQGLEQVKSMLDGVLMPTPAAVLAAGELLSRGEGGSAGLGPLMTVDIGGATTDIHSYAEKISFPGAKIIGAREGYSKRTVEGDLGIRESAHTLAGEIGWEGLASQLGIPGQALTQAIGHRVAANEFLPGSDLEKKIDRLLAAGAAKIAARRHAGYLEHIHSSGCKLLQKGKNLSGIGCVIGTGGPIIHSGQAREILRGVLANSQEPDILLPEQAKFFLDADYVLYAAGLLREIDRQTALAVMKKSLIEVVA